MAGGVTTRIYVGVQDIIEPEKFRSGRIEEESGSLKIRTSAPVCSGQPSSNLRTLPIHRVWIIKGRKKSRQYFDTSVMASFFATPQLVIFQENYFKSHFQCYFFFKIEWNVRDA